MNMSRSEAPMAFRTPISRILSVIDASMMFAMTTPPTKSETKAIAQKMMLKKPSCSAAAASVRTWTRG